MRKLYLYVTADKYELPIAVSDTPQGLADMLGNTKNGVLSCISHAKGKEHQRYYRIYYTEKEWQTL